MSTRLEVPGVAGRTLWTSGRGDWQARRASCGKELDAARTVPCGQPHTAASHTPHTPHPRTDASHFARNLSRTRVLALLARGARRSRAVAVSARHLALVLVRGGRRPLPLLLRSPNVADGPRRPRPRAGRASQCVTPRGRCAADDPLPRRGCAQPMVSSFPSQAPRGLRRPPSSPAAPPTRATCALSITPTANVRRPSCCGTRRPGPGPETQPQGDGRS